jgi:biotin carboxyl carrier protein
MHDAALALDDRAVGDIVMIDERLVLSPRKGTFVPMPPEVFTTEGEWVEVGQELAEIHCGVDVVPVVSAFSGWVMGMLAIPGQPVGDGVALFRIRP